MQPLYKKANYLAAQCAPEYNDISATNVNDSEKTVTVSEMYGATASIKIGRSF